MFDARRKQTMEDLLEQLVTEVQQHHPQTEERHNALTQLVNCIMRSRKICRPLGSQPLFGLYREMYEKLRQQLFWDIAQNLNYHQPTQKNSRAWAKNLLNDACVKILDNTQLKNLALEAQKHQPRSELRQYALRELIQAILLTDKLGHPPRGNFSPESYPLVYQEAVNQTLAYVCRNINTYNPERGELMTWVNFRLNMVFKDFRQGFYNPNIQNLPLREDLENRMVQPEEPTPLSEVIRQYIEDDPDNIFARDHIRNRPDANFRAIALAIFVGRTWKELSVEFNIPMSSLSRFFQRCSQKHRSLFQKFL